MRIADHIENAEPVAAGSHMYKALRSDGHYSAVQVYPFQLTPEQFKFFTAQVKQLGEIYIEYRAAIPKVLSHGFTKTGAFPFIEWEWIDGHDLSRDETLPLDSIINIAEEISRVMAHCHNLDLIHGNIRSSNVLWDEKQKHYLLTGFRFGLQPTKEVRTKGNLVTVIAPEQKDVTATAREDVRDIGRLLLHLLTGKDFHTADNLEELRRRHIPNEWNEKPIPQWFIECIERSIGVSREEPFEHAGELHHYILTHHKPPFQKKDWYRSKPQSFTVAVEPRPPMKMPRFSRKNLKLLLPQRFQKTEDMRFVFDRNIAAGLIIAALLVGFSIYAQKREKMERRQMAENRAQLVKDTTVSYNTTTEDSNTAAPGPIQDRKPAETKVKKEKPVEKKQAADTSKPKQPAAPVTGALGSYKVRSKAYFHNAPDESTRRNAFIVHWNNAVLHPTKEENGFVYVVFTNEEGHTSKGWLKKSDLVKQ